MRSDEAEVQEAGPNPHPITPSLSLSLSLSVPLSFNCQVQEANESSLAAQAESMRAREQAAEEASQRGEAAEKELLLFEP